MAPFGCALSTVILRRIRIRTPTPFNVWITPLDDLKDANFYTHPDLACGFRQVRVHIENIHKTAFRTPNGMIYDDMISVDEVRRHAVQFMQYSNCVSRENEWHHARLFTQYEFTVALLRNTWNNCVLCVNVLRTRA
jgi:hypothetical protein